MKNIEFRFVNRKIELPAAEGSSVVVTIKELQYRERESIPKVAIDGEAYITEVIWGDWYIVEEIDESDITEDSEEETPTQAAESPTELSPEDAERFKL